MATEANKVATAKANMSQSSRGRGILALRH
jgi:hypothetical protein